MPKAKVKESQKWIYVSASVFLGFLASLMIHAIIEIAYINWALAYGATFNFVGNSTLPLLLQISVAAFGILAGLQCGLNWWNNELKPKKSK